MSEETNENGVVDSIEALDFDVNNEYKVDPLIPKSTYHGAVTKVVYDAAGPAIVWNVCLHDNGGLMNDDSTPIDGAVIQFRNWLPKPGDENIMTKSGKNNKRQSKINMLKDFEGKMDINMSTPAIIAQALSEQVWLGLEVDVDIDIDEYEGKFRNVANRMRKSQMY